MHASINQSINQEVNLCDTSTVYNLQVKGLGSYNTQTITAVISRNLTSSSGERYIKGIGCEWIRWMGGWIEYAGEKTGATSMFRWEGRKTG